MEVQCRAQGHSDSTPGWWTPRLFTRFRPVNVATFYRQSKKQGAGSMHATHSDLHRTFFYVPVSLSLPPRVAFTEHRATEPTRLLVHSAGDSIHHAARYHGFHYWNAFCVRSHKNDALNFKEEINNKRLSIEIWRGKRASARPGKDGVTCLFCTVLLCSFAVTMMMFSC